MTRFFAHPEDDGVEELELVEAQAMERVEATLAGSAQLPPETEPSR